MEEEREEEEDSNDADEGPSTGSQSRGSSVSCGHDTIIAARQARLASVEETGEALSNIW